MHAFPHRIPEQRSWEIPSVMKPEYLHSAVRGGLGSEGYLYQKQVSFIDPVVRKYCMYNIDQMIVKGSPAGVSSVPALGSWSFSSSSPLQMEVWLMCRDSRVGTESLSKPVWPPAGHSPWVWPQPQSIFITLQMFRCSPKHIFRHISQPLLHLSPAHSILGSPILAPKLTSFMEILFCCGTLMLGNFIFLR